MTELTATMDQAACLLEYFPEGDLTGVKILLDIDRVLSDDEIAALDEAA